MKICNIGGQALIEGILMRNKDDYAIAVRLKDNQINIKKDKVNHSNMYEFFKKVPIIRGILGFGSSLSVGYKALSYSASFYEEEATDKKSASNQTHIDTAFMTITMILSIALSIGLFIILPYLLARILRNIGANDMIIALAEGIIRVAIFFAYMIFISMVKDIKRVLMYHGAEHKCINCIENEMPLTVENVMKSSRFHKRCGTGFLFYIIIISVILFMLIKVDILVLRVLIRILLVPLIAGVAYELLKLTGRVNNTFVKFISAPALFFQRFTTKEPSADMVEVAIKAVNEIYNENEPT